MSLRIETPGDVMYMPSAVAFDTATNAIMRSTPAATAGLLGRDGKMLRAFSADDRLKAPFDMVRLDNGQLWVVEKGRNSLTLIDVAAKRSSRIRSRTVTARCSPTGSPCGREALCPRPGQRPGAAPERRPGRRTALWLRRLLDGFADFALVGDSLWALETLGKKLYRFQPDGKIAETISLQGRSIFRFRWPWRPRDRSIFWTGTRTRLSFSAGTASSNTCFWSWARARAAVFPQGGPF